ncbi:single-strand DNA-binding protein [Metamycoplasma subdolum]|uniref:Single-stranded DNA-binding protein n=1 Tax=Metamycoplasma subdolum TaxID=92407 RepID=A0A3L9ZYH6_9BACT|nr:single-stranded DNA-binding protein [Metamycoplasma subdolum]RMA77427.1 single-strand DNA-binding protein [Metamycoplasma subdolum]WPB50396.1 single-stranded DNA-binding protein [Metamycoplasma subdolum]
MNKVILIGRLTNTPYKGMTTKEIEFSRFTIAVRRGYADANREPIIDFLPCVAWRKNAEFINKFLDKGSLILVEGTAQASRTKDANGQNVNNFWISAERVEPLETKTVADGRRKANTGELTLPSNVENGNSQNDDESPNENDGEFGGLNW